MAKKISSVFAEKYFQEHKIKLKEGDEFILLGELAYYKFLSDFVREIYKDL